MSTPSGGCTQHRRRGAATASPFPQRTAGWLLAGALLIGAAAARAAEPTGDQLFAAHCARAATARAAKATARPASTIKIVPPNLRTLAKRNGGQFPRDAVEAYIDGRKQVEAHGDRLMPVWGGFLQMPKDKGSQEPVRQRIAALADFIERYGVSLGSSARESCRPCSLDRRATAS